MPKRIHKKKHFKKKFKRESRLLSFKMTNASRIFTCIIACTEVFTVSVGNQSKSFIFPLNFPSYHQNNALTYGQMAAVSPALQRLLTLFDTYRVRKMKVMFVPNFVDTASTGIDLPAEIYMVHDNDDSTTAITTDIGALEDGSFPRGTASGKTSSKTIRQRKGTPWLNTANIAIAPGTATNSSTNLSPTIYESIKTFNPFVPTGIVPGRMIVEWIVSFRGFNTP